MTRLTRTVTTSVLTLVLLGLSFGPTALAKGPDSATLTGPGGATVDIATDDRRLMTLFMEQTGLWFGIGDLPEPIAAPTGSLGEPVVITWVNGGPPGLDIVSRTLVQHLYLLADGRVLIETPSQPSLSGWGEGVIGWFEAPPTFTDTLGQLGVDLAAMAAPPSGAGASLPWAGLSAALVIVIVLAALPLRRRLTTQPA